MVMPLKTVVARAAVRGRFVLFALACLTRASAADAQQWNDARVLTLVRQATDRRAQQLADSGLTDYQAVAHGYLTFLAQLGEGFREPPRVVKADELALEVYWRTPNLSKQRIVGRRDTTLLPTDIQYHRDHLGIVQNNFPAIIRLGDGDEVQDVPHPLSAAGIAEYEFALTDSLRIAIPGRVIGVYEVKVRPRDDQQPRVIGAVYLDRDNAQVVRMALSFTRAAFLDKQLEDLFIVLENGIVGAKFWLPRRQEVEIRRTATWMDYPARGIIRGRWEIGDYQLNVGVPAATFAGAEIVNAPQAVLDAYRWPSARILDSLPPDIRAVTADEVRRVQAEVRALVREQALRRVRGSALAARGVSDFVRYNRVEGVALGAGLSWQLGSGFGVGTRARYGIADQRTKGQGELTWQNAAGTSVRAYYADDHAQAGDDPERSLLINSLAAQELSSDYTDPYAALRMGITVAVTRGAARWSLDLARHRHRALQVNAAPASGRFEAPVAAAPVQLWQAAARLDRATSLGWLGTELRGWTEIRFSASDASIGAACGAGACVATRSSRAALSLEIERTVGGARVVARTFAAAVVARDSLLAQALVFLGGPMSAPGYAYHELVGDRAASQHVELQLPIPFPPLRLGRFGRSPARALLSPHLSAVALRQVPAETGILRSAVPFSPPDPLRARSGGVYPTAGVALITGFDLLRFDLSRGLRDGRWIFTFDVTRTFWSVM
jgi:hypothetical protein